MNTVLAQYRDLVVAHWRWLGWAILLALAATTLLLFVSPPLYRCHATVFVRTPGDVSQVMDGGNSYAQARARTYAAMASSSSVAARVIADLGLDMPADDLVDWVGAANPPGTALIDFSVSAPSGVEAQRIATVLLSEYAATVRELESVPGSVVPRAELVVVDPPSAPRRVTGWGVPIPLLLAVAVLAGAALGTTAVAIRSVCTQSAGGPVRGADIKHGGREQRLVDPEGNSQWT